MSGTLSSWFSNMADGKVMCGIKRSFLSQNSNLTKDKEVWLKAKKKLKSPWDFKDEQPSTLNQENAIFSLLSELEQF